MRRIAQCLVLLLAPVAAHAADAFDSPDRGDCSYTPGEVERVATPAAAVNLANATPPATKHVQAISPAAGGGSDDDLIPRLRAPKWHRLLPGMFR